MPVTDQTTSNSSTGNGVTTVYPYTFKILDQNDLLVEVDGVAKTLTTHYTVSGVGNSGGGNVTFTSPPALDAVVVVSRSMAYSRDTDYQENGDLRAATLDEDVDRVTMLIQQVRQLIRRAVKLPSGVTADQVLGTGNTAAERASKMIGFDSNGDLTLFTVADLDPSLVTAFIATLFDDASAAAARATLGAGATGDALFTSASAAAAWATVLAGASSQLGFRNKIINGGMQIVQRGAVALSATANTTYCADRITVQAAGGTGLAGNGANATSGGNTRSGYIAGAMACNWTSATMKVQTRLEDVSVIALNGKTVTVSGKLYHDLGSARTCQVVVQKANSANNFSATTTLGTSATFSATSGAYTSFSYTLALGGSDATNGLLISVEDTAASTATGKTFAVGDLQLEEGAVATPFEVRPYGLELALCQRYLPSFNHTVGNSFVGGGGFVNTSVADIFYPFKVRARTTPTGITTSTVGNFTLGGVVGTSSVATVISYGALNGDDGCSIRVTGTGTPYTAGAVAQLYTPSAGQILFTGCEL